MIENRHLRYFLAVAQDLHVTRAAARLHIAQPALTQNIQQLEAELEVELFRREGRRLTLTEAGHVFVKEAEASLGQFEHAQQAARRAARGEVGTLALGFQSTAGLSVVPQLLQRFRTSYPDVDVLLREMGTSAQITALRAGELDVALMYSLGSEEFAYRELVPESLVIALPEDHPLAQRDSVALKDLSQEVLILPAPEGRGGIASCGAGGVRRRGLPAQTSAGSGYRADCSRSGFGALRHCHPCLDQWGP